MRDRFYENDYFNWLLRKVKNKSHSELLRFLFETMFIYTMRMDENRASDGINLRYDYIYEMGIPEEEFPYLKEACNLFEMILALAIRINLIMSDPYRDDETSIWFWRMISNLGLSKMTNSNYNLDYIQEVVRHFLNRQYGPNGRGSLFYVHSEKNINDLQIWDQAMLYLNEFDERRNPHGAFD